MDQAPQSPQAPAPDQGGGATEMVTGAHDKLMQVQQALGQKLEPGDLQNLQVAIQAYEAFVEGLSAPPGGQKAPPPQGDMGVGSMEAGAANVKPAM